MGTITLTSDWNAYDHYLAAVKGKILSSCDTAQIIDLNHQVTSFDTEEAAFVIRNSYPHFPKGSIHLIAVNIEPKEEKSLVAARKNGHYFLCADNGLLGLLGGDGPEIVVELEQDNILDISPFDYLGILAEAACKLLGGTKLEMLGKVSTTYEKQTPMRATIEKDIIIGNVIYIDSYQNAITNISSELFDQVGKKRPYEILVQSRYNTVNRISKHYHESEEGEILAIFNSTGLLEIAIRNGNAASLLNLSTNSTVRVEFK